MANNLNDVVDFILDFLAGIIREPVVRAQTSQKSVSNVVGDVFDIIDNTRSHQQVTKDVPNKILKQISGYFNANFSIIGVCHSVATFSICCIFDLVKCQPKKRKKTSNCRILVISAPYLFVFGVLY